MGSPWVGMSSYSARIRRIPSRKLFRQEIEAEIEAWQGCFLADSWENDGQVGKVGKYPKKYTKKHFSEWASL